MRFCAKKRLLLLLCALLLPACMTAPAREELLSQKVIYNRSSDKNYLEIVECLESDDGFHLPKWRRHT